MLTDEEAERVVGTTLKSADGDEVGEVEAVVAHAADNRAAWAAVKIDDHTVLVPLDEARTENDQLVVRYDEDAIRSAPAFEDSDTLTREDAEKYYEHYGIDDSVLRDHGGFATEAGSGGEDASRDPRGGGGASDAEQGHP